MAGELTEKGEQLGLIPNTIYDKQDLRGLVSVAIKPLEGPGLSLDDPISDNDCTVNTIDFLYLPTGVQTKEGFEYKFVRPLRG